MFTRPERVARSGRSPGTFRPRGARAPRRRRARRRSGRSREAQPDVRPRVGRVHRPEEIGLLRRARVEERELLASGGGVVRDPVLLRIPVVEDLVQLSREARDRDRALDVRQLLRGFLELLDRPERSRLAEAARFLRLDEDIVEIGAVEELVQDGVGPHDLVPLVEGAHHRLPDAEPRGAGGEQENDDRGRDRDGSKSPAKEVARRGPGIGPRRRVRRFACRGEVGSGIARQAGQAHRCDEGRAADRRGSRTARGRHRAVVERNPATSVIDV